MDQSKPFITSLFFALLGVALVYFWVEEKENQLRARYGVEVPVVVAKRDINDMQPIREEFLEVVMVPKSYAQPGSQEDISAFKGTIAAAPIKKGEQVLATKVLMKDEKTGLATQVSISNRAFSLSVTDATGVTKLIQPGDRVDVIAAIPYNTASGPQTEVKTMLQNVHVLAVGSVIQNHIPKALERDPVTGRTRNVNMRGRNYTTVSIEVSPQEAQALVYVLQSGAEIYLTLRNPVDRTVVSVPTTTVDEVLGPNSKKLGREIASPRNESPRPVEPSPAPPVVLPPPPPPKVNPFKAGGGSLVQ